MSLSRTGLIHIYIYINAYMFKYTFLFNLNLLARTVLTKHYLFMMHLFLFMKPYIFFSEKGKRFL